MVDIILLLFAFVAQVIRITFIVIGGTVAGLVINELIQEKRARKGAEKEATLDKTV